MKGKNMEMDIGLIQTAPHYSLSVTEEMKMQNLNQALEMIEEVMAEGPVDMIILPEFAFTGPISVVADPDRMIKEDPAEDSAVAVLAQNAYEKKTPVIAPLFLRKGKQYFNACTLISAQGEIIGTYCKVHPYPPEKPTITRGREFPVFGVPGLQEPVGLQICYDLAFPEAARILALKGAGIIFYPTMSEDWMMDAFEAIAVARAIENRIFVVVSNPVTTHPRTGGTLSGRSFVATPGGRLISLGQGKKARRISIALEERTEALERMNFWVDRNPEAYYELNRS